MTRSEPDSAAAIRLLNLDQRLARFDRLNNRRDDRQQPFNQRSFGRISKPNPNDSWTVSRGTASSREIGILRENCRGFAYRVLPQLRVSSSRKPQLKNVLRFKAQPLEPSVKR